MLWGKLAAILAYAAAAALLLWLAHRAVRRLSRAAALTLALLPLAFTGPALLTGRVYSPFDLAYGSDPLRAYRADYGLGDARGIFVDIRGALIPWQKAVRWALGHGDWPLWNPFALCGEPLAGSVQPAPYYPVNAIALLVPLPWALTLTTALQLLLAAVGAFLYLRELGIRESVSALGAAAWIYSSFVAFWILYPLGVTLSLAPLVLLAVRRAVREPGARACALLTAAMTLAALAGHPESLTAVVVVGGLAGLYEAAFAAAAPGGRRRLAAATGWAALAGAASLGLSAIFLLPFLEVLPQTLEWTMRRGSGGVIHAGASAAASFRHLGLSLLPPQDDSPGRFLLPPLASAYAGSLLWAPAIYGLWRCRRRDTYLLAGLGFFGLLAGARVPGVMEAIGSLPLLHVSLNERFVFLFPLALAALAALGLETWLREGRGMALGALAAGLTAALGATLAALFPGARSAGADPAVYAGWSAWAIAPALLGAGVLLFARRHERRAVLAFGLLLLVQRFGEQGSLVPTLRAEAFYPRVPPLDALPRGAEPYRVVGHQFALTPDDATMWELEDPRGYQAIHHGRFAATNRLWAAPDSLWFARASNLEAAFLNFLNVRYALASPSIRPRGWTLVRRSKGAWLWSNPRALPRAFVPRRVRVGVAAEPTLRQMGRETDFAKRAWIEPPPEPGAKPWSEGETRNGRGTVTAERQGTGYRLRADMDEPGWVVISETAWKGWQATAGGRALPLGIANHAFLALELPAGSHTVDLVYRPRGFLIGRSITGVTLAVLAAAAFAGRRRRGARATPDEAVDVRRVGDRVAVPGGYQHRALHEGPAPQRFWHDAKLREALTLLDIRPGLALLDAGCGSGLLTDRAAAAGARVLAVDANPAAIEFATRAFARPGIEFRLGLLDELDLPRDHFDRIVFLEVIEHLGRKQGSETLARFRDLLVPGGRLVLSTPNRKSLWPLIEWLLDRLRLVPPLAGEQHETLYSLDELTAAAESQGLRTVERRMINTFAPWLAWISPRLARTVHGWELRHVRRHGSIMLVAFEKPPAGLATRA